MSKLQTYVLKEVVKAFLLAFLVLLAVMMLGFGVQLLQEGLDIVRLRGLPFYMAVYCMPWVLPSALLTAVIMVFGRLSADKEILAMQVEGMHLWHILNPVYIFAILLSLVGAYLHFEGAPRARFNIENMQSKALMQVLRDRILYSSGRRFYVSPYMVSYENYNDGVLEGIRIVRSGGDGGLSIIINARRGHLHQPEHSPNMLELVLEECAVTQLTDAGIGGPGTVWAGRGEFPMRVGSLPREDGKDIKHMTFRELRGKRSDLKKHIREYGWEFRNPSEKSDELSDEISALNAQRSELRRVLDRMNSRIGTLEVGLANDRQLIRDREQQLQRRESDLLALRAQKVDYVQTLERLLDDEEEEERLARMSETQRELTGIRNRISGIEEKSEEVQEELAGLKASERVKRRNVRNLKNEKEALENEIASLTGELDELREKKAGADRQEDLREVEIRTQRRLTLAFAALMFTVLGIPLGLLSQRHSTLMAFGIGFFVMLAIFYPFMVWGQIMAETGLLHVVPAMWTGNAVTFVIGASMTLVLFRR